MAVAGAAEVGEAAAYGVPPLRRLGVRSTVPAVLLVGVVFATLLSIAVATSLGTYNDRYELVLFPPSLDAYVDFAEIPGPLFLETILRVAPPLLLAAVPSSFAGYFLGRRAPRVVRRVGVVLLLAAWALTFERNLAMFHLATPTVAGWFPWMAVTFPGAASLMIFYAAMPPIALCVYSAHRGGFLGLPWPGSAGTPSDRFVYEVLPRTVAGAALGIVVAGAYVLLDLVLAAYSTRGEVGIVSYIVEQSGLIGGGPLSAAGAVIVFLVLGAALLVFFLWLWAVRMVTARRPATPADAPPSRRNLASDVAAGVGIVALGFLLVSAFVPIAIAFLFSFNSTFSFGEFGGWSTDWYYNPRWTPGDSPVPPGIFNLEAFLESMGRAVGLSLVTALVVVPIAVLAAAGSWNLPPRTRAKVRGVLYVGAFLPITLTTLMASYAILLGSGSVFGGQMPEPWDAVAVGVPLLPMALGYAFIVAASSSDWRQAWAVGGTWTTWVRPAAAAFLTTFGFLMSAFGAIQAYSLGTFLYAYVSRNILTPLVDAGLVFLSLSTIVPILVAALLVRDGDRELFRL
jgi:hypothetical protein